MRKSLLPVLAASGAVVVFGLLVLRLATGKALPLAVVLLVGGVCVGVIAGVLWIDRREKRRIADAAGVRRVRAAMRPLRGACMSLPCSERRKRANLLSLKVA